jgi:hypothetical protein
MGSKHPVSIVVLAVGIALASTGCLRFTVEKRVTAGAAPSAANVYWFCTNDQGLQEGSFDINGGDFVPVIVFRQSATSCVFSEPQKAGATSVKLECVDPPPEVACNFQESDKALVVVAPGTTDPSLLDLSIRITNDYAVAP